MRGRRQMKTAHQQSTDFSELPAAHVLFLHFCGIHRVALSALGRATARPMAHQYSPLVQCGHNSPRQSSPSHNLFSRFQNILLRPLSTAQPISFQGRQQEGGNNKSHRRSKPPLLTLQTERSIFFFSFFPFLACFCIFATSRSHTTTKLSPPLSSF